MMEGSDPNPPEGSGVEPPIPIDVGSGPGKGCEPNVWVPPV